MSGLSGALRLGRHHGFDSGVVLDYVYQNRPSGVGWIGKQLDRICLNSVGWRASRERYAVVKNAVVETILRNSRSSVPSKLLDVGCGSGRYIFEALQACPHADVTCVLLDYRPESCAQAEKLAQTILAPVTVRCGDAFSDEVLRGVVPRPNIIVAAGLHEVVADDALVSRHFHQLFEVLDRPGRLIFTVQPHHPQAELVARLLPAHTGLPWVMRLRPLGITKQWALDAGFTDIDARLDAFGICGVVTAEKK